MEISGWEDFGLTSIRLRALPSKVAYPVTAVTDRASPASTTAALSSVSLGTLTGEMSAPKQLIIVSSVMAKSRGLSLRVAERYLGSNSSTRLSLD